MKRRAERTYFNTEYMPELYEDAIESNDPQEVERMTHGHPDDVIYQDRRRFGQVCRQFKWDGKEIAKEHKRKHPQY